MSIKAKVLAVLLGFLLLTAGYSLLLLEKSLAPSFRELERDLARQDLGRVVRALQREIALLDSLNHDWASWDDTYAFIASPDEAYIETNLLDATFKDSRLSLAAFLDLQGRVVWQKAFDLEAGKPMGLPDIPDSGLPPRHPLLRPLSTDSPVTGLWSTSAGPMLVSSRPLLTSNNTGPARGVLIMGRLLLPRGPELLAEQTQVDLAMLDLAGGLPETPAMRLANAALREPDRTLLRDLDENLLLAATVLDSIAGQPLALVEARIPRDVTARGKQAVQLAGLSLVAAGGVTLLALALVLHLLVVRPLRGLTRRVQEVAESNDPTARTNIRARTEIGTLSTEFDALLDRLERTRSRLLESSYLTGMAELAGNVLHNVRQAFTPVAGNMDDLSGALKRLPLDDLRQTLEALRTLPPDMERRDALMASLVATIDDLSGFMAMCAKTVREAKSRVDRVEDLLTVLEDRPPPGFEQAPPAELAAVALALLEPSHRELLELAVNRSLETPEEFGGRRSLVELALAAVLRESARAYAESGAGRGEVVLSLARVPGVLHFTASDRAPGDPQHRLNRLLTMGPPAGNAEASPQAWSREALAAAGMAITAEAAPGRGAAFTVSLLARAGA